MPHQAGGALTGTRTALAPPGAPCATWPGPHVVVVAPTIALDADDVLFPFTSAYAAWRTARGLASFDPATVTSLDFSSLLGPDDDHATEFLHDGDTLATAPVPGAAEAVRELAATHRLVVVTYRYGVTQAGATRQWLARWLPDVDDVVFARTGPGDPGTPKAEVCAALGATWLVDDRDDHLRPLVGTRGLLFGDYPWQLDTAGVERAQDWPAVVATVTADPA